MGVVVFNNSITITNNLNIGTNAEEVYSNIYDKGHIALQSVRKFNTNWDWFTDNISCPTNVTMSGTTSKETWITTQMAYDHGTIYCKWDYKWDEFRIYFNIDKTDYDSAYYKWDLVKLKYETTIWSTTLDEDTNVAEWLPVSTSVSETFNSSTASNSNDWDVSTEYVSYRQIWKKSSLIWKFIFWDKYIWRIIIKKRYWTSSRYWDKAYLRLYDIFWNQIGSDKLISWARDWSWDWWEEEYHYETKTYCWGWYCVDYDEKVIDYIYYTYDIWISAALANKVHSVELITKRSNKYLDLYEFEMYEYTTWLWLAQWVWEEEFDDDDSTLISFDEQWTGWWDKIDDNMNSDDYKWWSIDDNWNYIEYAFWYEDDDILPRKTFWGNVPVWYQFYNIFWNNYKTNDFIDNNPYNNIWYSKKISEVGTGYLYLDTYNTDNKDNSVFDLKIIQFDRDKYKQLNTLLPVKSWEGKDINNFVWYIQLSDTWSLSLAYYKTWKEFPFNFKDNDYAIFITNKNKSGDISYILKWETDTGSWIYINPINDSLTWTVEVMANHMLMGWEKNFIWNNFIVVWAK